MKLFLISLALFLSGCEQNQTQTDNYFVQIEEVHMRIPKKYSPDFCFGFASNEIEKCKKNLEVFAKEPPGWRAASLRFIEQDFDNFEGYESSGVGVSHSIRYALIEKSSVPNGRHLPNSESAWNSKNRDHENDKFELKAYKHVIRDDVNYEFDFADGRKLLMTCKSFNLPNPECEAITSWRGIHLQIVFKHRNLSEWKDLHLRLVRHLESFVQ